MKIIKLSDTHYIGVDSDSEIKKGDYDFSVNYRTITYVDKERAEMHKTPAYKGLYKKITHSTQPLDCNCAFNNRKLDLNCAERNHCFYTVKPLSLSEVEEAIYGYSVEKMAHNWATRQTTRSTDYWRSLVRAYKDAHKELVKDKVFTVEDVENILIKFHKMNMAYLTGKADDNLDIKDFISTVLLKTEWECTIDEQGKIVLL